MTTKPKQKIFLVEYNELDEVNRELASNPGASVVMIQAVPEMVSVGGQSIGSSRGGAYAYVVIQYTD